ncbi:MAG: hypothetical protein AAF731_15150 [Bacteroidota bacterium]
MKRLLYMILSLAALVFASYFVIDEKLPDGQSGTDAEALADKILTAVNIQGWDSITAIKWTFHDAHYFLWDKKRNLVEVRWDQYKVHLNTRSGKGKAWDAGNKVINEEIKTELLQKAWSYFANDSFWFSAPFKIRDPGTERRIVKLKKSNGLLVTYTSGGVTPGDSYLWLFNEQGLPESWKMWVSVLPVGGLQFTWQDWQEYDFGVKISTTHIGIIDVIISDFETAYKIEDIADGQDPFATFN